MALLYLVRHGETDWNREDRWQGHHDRPLSARGRAQAATVAGRLVSERLTQIHSSDLKRASQTAKIIAEACALGYNVDRALREVDVGNWAGLTRSEARKLFPEGYARRRAGGTGWEGGESYEQMGERVRTYVTRVLDDSPGSARIALICHSGVIRVLVAYALELGPANRGCIGGNEHGALSVLRMRKGKWSLRLYNDACHLRAGDASSTTSKGRAPHARGR
jgi:broad specificity phosphatase PhoE